jgi:hypothetical protein
MGIDSEINKYSEKTMKLTLAFCLLLSSAAFADDVPTAAERIGLEFGPDTTVVNGPLNEQGYPDYVRWLDDQMAAGITAEENVWAQLWHATGNWERSSPEFLEALELRLGVSVSREQRWVSFVNYMIANYSDTDPRIV